MTPPAAAEPPDAQGAAVDALSRIKVVAELVSFLVFCCTILFAIAIIADNHWAEFIVFAAALVVASALTSLMVPRRLRVTEGCSTQRVLRQQQRLRRLVRLEMALAGVTFLLSFALPRLAGDTNENGVFGPLLLVMVTSSAVVHFFVRVCAKNYGVQPRNGAAQVAAVAGAMVFVASVAFVAGAAWALGGRAWSFPTPTEVAMLNDPNARPSPRQRESSRRSNESGGTERTERILETPAPPEEAGAGGVEDEAACRLKTRVALLETAPMKLAGRAMWREWVPIGPDVTGCVERLEERSGRLVATLRGGKSDPSLLVSDRLGRAAIVFEELVWVVDQLLHDKTLRYVGPRVGTGYGNYQTFFLRDGRCMMAGRVFPNPYVTVPPAATVLVINEAASRRKFPSIVGETGTTRRHKIHVIFQGADGSDERDTILVSNNRTAWVKGHPDRAVSANARCSDQTGLQSLADALFQRYLREHPELLN